MTHRSQHDTTADDGSGRQAFTQLSNEQLSRMAGGCEMEALPAEVRVLTTSSASRPSGGIEFVDAGRMAWNNVTN